MPINHSLTATTPDDPAWEIRPSHWNSQHVVALVGSEVIGAFSNAGNVSFGVDGGGFVTASANVTAAPSPVNVTGANGSSVNAQTIAFSNANGLSLGVSTAANGATVTGSYTVPTQTSLSFANSNGVSFGTNGSTVTATVATNYQSQGAYLTTAAQSNQVVNSLNGSTGQISLNAGSSLSASTNGSAITFGLASNITTALQSAGAYLTTARASNDAIGLNSAVSNVTATINSSGLSLDARGYAGTGTSATNASITLNSNGLQISVAAPGGAGVALYDGANSISTGTARFSNANGVSFGFNGQTITASVAAAGGAQTGISSVAISDATYTSGQISFRDLNGITWGTTTGQAIQITHALQYTSATSAITSNALHSTASRVSALNGSSGGISLAVASSLSSSTNGSTITFGLASNITTALQSAGAYLTTARASTDAIGLNTAQTNVTWTVNSSGLSINAGGYAGTTSGFTGANISASITHNTAGIALSMSVAAPGAAAENNAVNLLGANTAGNTTASGSTLGFSGLNMTLSGTNASQIVMSVPATSSLSATGQVSISTNGSTISIGVPFGSTESGFNPYGDFASASTAWPAGSFLLDPESFPSVQFDRVGFPIAHSNATNSSGSYTLSYVFGLYTRNGSTLSLAASASTALAITGSGTQGVYASYGGTRVLTLGLTTTLTAGRYWMGFGFRSTSGGANASFTNYVISAATDAYGGLFGQTTAASNQLTLGQGFYSATTAGVPSSIAFSQINGTNSNAQRQHVIMFYSSTV